MNIVTCNAYHKVEYIAHLNVHDVIGSHCTQTIHVYSIAFFAYIKYANFVFTMVKVVCHYSTLVIRRSKDNKIKRFTLREKYKIDCLYCMNRRLLTIYLLEPNIILSSLLIWCRCPALRKFSRKQDKSRNSDVSF